MEKKYEVNCDYELVLLLSDNSETLIGGSEKTINKALKNLNEPNLAVKELDIFFREQYLGTFALDLCRSFPESEKIQEQVDRLYANLKDENTNKSRVAETLNTLDYIFKVDKSAPVRLLARVVLKMYRAVTGLYMNARFGLGMKQADRAELGEQFRSDVELLISDTFTTLKKKKSPQDTEILSIIRFDCGDVAKLLTEYLLDKPRIRKFPEQKIPFLINAESSYDSDLFALGRVHGRILRKSEFKPLRAAGGGVLDYAGMVDPACIRVFVACVLPFHLYRFTDIAFRRTQHIVNFRIHHNAAHHSEVDIDAFNRRAFCGRRSSFGRYGSFLRLCRSCFGNLLFRFGGSLFSRDCW